MSLSHEPSCAMYNKLPPTSSSSPHRVVFKSDVQESVDLLRMVPETRPYPQDAVQERVLLSPKHNISDRSSDSIRLNRISRLTSSTEDVTTDEGDSGVHVCQDCRSCSVYYSTQPRSLPGTSSQGQVKGKAKSLSSMTGSDHEEGSVYFNYIQFSKDPHQACIYEPVYKQSQKLMQSKHKSNEKCLLNCCKPPEKNCSNSPYKSKCAPAENSPKCKKNFHAESLQKSIYANTVNQEIRRETKAKNRLHIQRISLRRWLFFAAVLLGITLALVGLVVGFVILGPYPSDQEGECREGYAPCGEKTCVSIRHYCAGAKTRCPNLNPHSICPPNMTGTKTGLMKPAVSEGTSTAAPPSSTTPAPLIPDANGWVVRQHLNRNASKYTTLNTATTFSSAQDECRKRGGHLAHVNTLREQIFIMDYLGDILRLTDTYSDGVGFWLGARRQRGSHSGPCMFDQWKWLGAHGQTLDVVKGFSAFIPGKPDDFYEPEECLFISYEYSPDDDKYLMWDDAPCDINSLGRINIFCEVELD